MRRWILQGCSVLLVLAMMTTTVFAAPVRKNTDASECRKTCSFYLDADKDGICDNAATGKKKTGRFTDKNGDGICDNREERRSTRISSFYGRQGKGCRKNR